MGRKPRRVSKGALYHIVQRGNNRNYVYENITDKNCFLRLLVESKEVGRYRILYYVLMDNHYHLILESGEVPYWKGLQWLNTTYSKYYNKKYNRSGGIYEGRYSAWEIGDTRHYYQLLKYIAENPVKAGIVKKPRDYRWSAHPDIIASRNQIVDVARTLSYFPGPLSKAKAEYIDLIEHERTIKSDYGLVPTKDEQKLKDALDFILSTFSFPEQVVENIRQGRKATKVKTERDQFIAAAYQAGFSVREIAEYLSLSYEGVRKIIAD